MSFDGCIVPQDTCQICHDNTSTVHFECPARNIRDPGERCVNKLCATCLNQWIGNGSKCVVCQAYFNSQPWVHEPETNFGMLSIIILFASLFFGILLFSIFHVYERYNSCLSRWAAYPDIQQEICTSSFITYYIKVKNNGTGL